MCKTDIIEGKTEARGYRKLNGRRRSSASCGGGMVAGIVMARTRIAGTWCRACLRSLGAL